MLLAVVAFVDDNENHNDVDGGDVFIFFSSSCALCISPN